MQAVSTFAGRVKVLRVITRMTTGPAFHVSILSGLLTRERYETLLIAGKVRPGEASFAHLADEYGASLRVVEPLGPELRPRADARSLFELIRIFRAFGPHIVHTHTAKAGMLGRLASLTLPRPRPVVVHTYHGHVLEGVFGPFQATLYRIAERLLARTSDCLIGVSQSTVDDLVRLGIAPRSKFRVIPLGLDLEPFLSLTDKQGQSFRAEIGLAPDDVLFVYAGRLVRPKRVDVAIRALAHARAREDGIKLAIVGDGPLRTELEALARSLGVESHVRFLGHRSDMTRVFAAADVALLTSDCAEGTPVFLIEAAAAGCPAVATRVNGVPEVVTAATGILVSPGDVEEGANAMLRLARNPNLRVQMGRAARTHVSSRYTSSRLVRNIDALYEELLGLDFIEAAATAGGTGRQEAIVGKPSASA